MGSTGESVAQSPGPYGKPSWTAKTSLATWPASRCQYTTSMPVDIGLLSVVLGRCGRLAKQTAEQWGRGQYKGVSIG